MAAPQPDGDLEALLRYLRDARGFDFSGYKRATLCRRIERRMQQAGADDYASYTALLEANPGEFAQLFDAVLVNVTGFLRDTEAWDYLTAEILPAVIAEREPGTPIRVWSAGTASGEEAYSLAVLLAELLGEEEFRATVKVYATDADEAALAEARHARYPTSNVVKAFGGKRAARFFEVEGTTSVFRQDLRRSLIFGRHDLVEHAPISRINLLVCRNTLMYFTTEMQQRVISNFEFALAEGGYLFLGKSEAVLTQRQPFEVASKKYRVFQRSVEGLPGRGAMPELAAIVVLDSHMTVRSWNRAAEHMWGLRADEAEGAYFSNLDIGLPMEELGQTIRACLNGSSPGEQRLLHVAKRQGRSVERTARVSPVRAGGDIIGAMLMMEA